MKRLSRVIPLLASDVLRIFFLVAALIALSRHVFSQVENVPIRNPVYDFLLRMEAKGLIARYHNGALPLSRMEVASLLKEVGSNDSMLSNVERGYLRRLQSEFSFELGLPAGYRTSLLGQNAVSAVSWAEQQKFLYQWIDTSSFPPSTLFVDGILNEDARSQTFASGRSRGVSLTSFGGRFRGSLRGILGYFLQGTNGQLLGNKEYGLTDPFLQQNYKIHETGSVSFDEVRAYLRLHTPILGAELGRERLWWGNGIGERLILSRFSPVFDFIRLDATYGVFKYSFIHGWLLGSKKIIYDAVEGLRTIIPSKYIAAHRGEVSLKGIAEAGVTEMIIYANRNPDLAYLNPINFYKSAEHALQDRDNAILAFDGRIRCFPRFMPYGTFLIDDISFGKLGTAFYGNELAGQIGFFAVDPLDIPNTQVVLEYTRIDPYVYSHRLNETNYTSNGFLLGDPIGPNSESYYLSFQWQPRVDLFVTLSGNFLRHGANVVDSTGAVIRNVGGDPLVGHRTWDSEDAPFLDGVLQKDWRIRFSIRYEPIWEMPVTFQYEYHAHDEPGHHIVDHQVFVQLTIDY